MRKRKRTARERETFFIRAAVALLIASVSTMLLSQTALAQTTYVITDGSRVLVHTTSATDPKDVLGEAGLALGADDSYTAQAGERVSEIQVRRSQLIRIHHYGRTLEVCSFGETVAELLNRLGLKWDEDDLISIPLDRRTYSGMELTVAQVVRQVQTYTAMVPRETVRCDAPGISAGVEQVLTEGADGEMICTALVTYINGEETGRTVLSRQITKQPVDRVIGVGTAEAELMEQEDGKMPIIGENTITLPTGEVLTYTGTAQFHATAYTHTDPGCDFITATMTRVRIGTVAVDPRVIPYGTRMFIVTNDGAYVYGVSTAEDCGGAIKGKRLDLYFPTYDACIQFGRRDCTVYFLN